MVKLSKISEADNAEIEAMPLDPVANDRVKPHPHERGGSASSREIAEPDPSAASTILLGGVPENKWQLRYAILTSGECTILNQHF